MGFITPCIFCVQAMWNKHMTSATVGFDATTLSIGASFVAGLIILVIAVSWYWQYMEQFDPRLFAFGFAASIFDSLGKAFILNAWAVGPAGIVGAFCELSNVGLLVVEAIREMRVPSGLELGSFIFAILGALWFAIPDELFKLIEWVSCSRCCNPRKEKTDEEEEMTISA